MSYPNPGYIREEQDVMYLILYALGFFQFPISESDLMDVVLVDEGFGYFEFRSAFLHLLERGHVTEIRENIEPLYLITAEGSRAIEVLASRHPCLCGTRPNGPRCE